MKIFSLIFLFAITLGVKAQESVIEINFDEKTKSIQLQVGEEKITVKPEENGKAVVKTKISSPQYANIMRVASRPEVIYLYPNDKLEVSITGSEYGKLDFKGKHAKLNAYLVNPSSIALGGNFSLSEMDYINSLKSRVDQTIEKMLSLGVDKEFSEKEKKRIAAKIYTYLITYPSIRRRTEREYRPSQFYYDFVNKQIFEDDKMLFLKEYGDYMQYLVQMMATKDIVKYDPFVNAETTLKYVVANIKNEKVKSHLVNFYAYDFLKRNGVEQAEPITAIFKKYVKDPEKNKIYDNTWETWSKLTPGRMMPDLVFHDISGKEVPLSSLKGKYVYIDVWATWCKPCIAEIPNLKKMEHALEGKNVVFVSVSTDKDADAWKKMVVEDNFTGVQLHARSRDFSDELMIVSIPRFILLDPNGKIVDANVSRPNRPETYQLMDTLPGL